MSHNNRRFLEQLTSLKLQLKQLKLWDTVAPSAEKLTSTVPFCADTLRFEQWLQFIFIPKFEAMLLNGQALPKGFCITPMAEQSLTLAKYRPIIEQLRQIDELAN